jgi:predicted alpha/beta-fold hydrolase
VRDIWFDRWDPISLEDLEVSKCKIKVEGGFLSANLVALKDQQSVKIKNTLVIMCHGFSDTKETHQYFYYPLAYHGYTVLTYDARGIGESKKTGKRNQFLQRIDDFNTILKWIENNSELNQMNLYSVGFSIGAMTVLCGGFQNQKIEKITAISAVSDYREHASVLNPIVKFSYRLKGVNLYPNERENTILSPFHVMKHAKNTLPPDQWEFLSKRILLIHSRNDKIIKFRNFEKNRALLELPDKNIVILKKGGHTLKKDELVLVGATLKFFDSNL